MFDTILLKLDCLPQVLNKDPCPMMTLIINAFVHNILGFFCLRELLRAVQGEFEKEKKMNITFLQN